MKTKQKSNDAFFDEENDDGINYQSNKPVQRLESVKDTKQKLEPKKGEIKQKPKETEIQNIESFEDMNLKENLLRGVYGHGFEKPSEVQSKAIMPMIKGNEMIVQAQSGTGKTGTFTISMLQIIDEKINSCQALIITPTHELAIQITNVVQGLGHHLEIKTALCIGGTNVNDSRYDIEGAHVIVGTPGRIMHMIKNNSIQTSMVKLLILDEADEMLSGGFKTQVKNIVQSLPNEIQICIFSATITSETLSITKMFMRNPVKILIEKEKLTLEGIKQFLIYVEEEQWKFATLCDLYESITVNQSIVYVNTKNKAEWLKTKLTEQNFTVAVIHSEMDSNDRYNIVKEFRNGKSRVLISTDLLSRGIDIQQISIVVNYDIPQNNECYIHRIGRSGRYGRNGIAINFVTSRDTKRIEDLEHHYKIKIDDMPKDITSLI